MESAYFVSKDVWCSGKDKADYPLVSGWSVQRITTHKETQLLVTYLYTSLLKAKECSLTEFFVFFIDGSLWKFAGERHQSTKSSWLCFVSLWLQSQHDVGLTKLSKLLRIACWLHSVGGLLITHMSTLRGHFHRQRSVLAVWRLKSPKLRSTIPTHPCSQTTSSQTLSLASLHQ